MPFISTPVAGVRRPRIGAYLNGKVITAGLIEFATASNNYWSADTFAATFAISALPKEFDLAYWADTDAIDIELWASFLDKPDSPTKGTVSWLPDTEAQPMIRGLVDQVAFSLDGTTIGIRGRDFSSLLIDTKTSEKFPNLTTSEIAKTVGERRGLKVDAIATSTKAGVYYKSEHIQMADEVSEWTLLTWLAEREGLDIWVQDKTLHLAKPPADDEPPLIVTWSAPDKKYSTFLGNSPRIALERNLTLARDIQVTVRSWNHEQKAPIVVTRRGTKVIRKGGKESSRNMPPHTYVFTEPGLTREQAERMAEKKLTELSRHERTMDISDLPGVNALSVRRKVRLTGTETAFDQEYYIVEIDRKYSFNDGATMSMRCKNSSPRNEVTI